MELATGNHDQNGVATHDAEDVRHVELRLTRVFGATLGADEVRRCVEAAYAHYDRVRVRKYVPLLAERRAARALRAIEQVGERSA